jgi:hypothetical protein
MASTLRFFAGDGSPEIAAAASGGLNTVGFFGGGFGLSIRVGEYNDNTYRTDENGTTNGGQLPNLKFANSSGAFVANEIVGTELLEVNNDEATLLIRLNTDSAIATQNTKFRAYDKLSINSDPSGVVVRAAEIRKEETLVRGSGDTSWLAIAGSGSVLSLDSRADLSTQKDFFIGLTATPTSIGEKTNFALYFETEFL